MVMWFNSQSLLWVMALCCYNCLPRCSDCQRLDSFSNKILTFNKTELELKKTRAYKFRLDDSKIHCYRQRYKIDNITGIAWRKELVSAAKKLSRKNSIVVTGGDWAYRATVLNWMAHADNIGMTEYIVLCYGESMLKLVGSWQDGGHGLLVKDCFRVIEFMFMKILTLFHLSMSDYIVTWSDCDALWLRPFMDEWILPHANTTNFLAQKALHPRDISIKTGSVICTGLFTVFPSVASTQIMTSLTSAMKNFRQASDQLLINKHLKAMRMFAFAEPVVFDDSNLVQTVTHPKYLKTVASSPHASVAFLPFGTFPRSRTDAEWARVQRHDPALWHSKTDKVGQSKIDGMMNSSVFALKAGWENITNSSEVAAFVDRELLAARGWKNVTAILAAAGNMTEVVGPLPKPTTVNQSNTGEKVESL